MPAINKTYLAMSVLEAARERMRLVFDRFERVYVSCSGGKDSTVLFHLAVQEAERRGRKVTLFFLDQEAEYQATIDVMRRFMAHPAVVPAWYQVPIYMTNTASYEHDKLYAWGEGEEWIREKEVGSIHAIEEKYPRRFYPFFEWYERTRPPGSAFLVGLRAEECIHRFRAVTKHPGMPDLPWSSKTKVAGSFKLYPIYDWGMGDVWKFILDNGIRYNRVYDTLFAMNHGIYHSMRVSNLIHEKSFSCLAELPLIEPETYAKLLRRVPGIHCAARHAKGDHIYAATTLPPTFPTWRAYRDHLLATMPIDVKNKARHEKRFAGQAENEATFKAQCDRLLLNDYEGSIPITTPHAKKDKAHDKFARWRKLF